MTESIRVYFANEDALAKCLSNLAYTPFKLDGYNYASVECFWQSLKFPLEERRALREIMDGWDIKQKGKFAPHATVFEYEKRLYTVASQAHHILLERAIRAKIGQNEKIREMLTESGDRKILHVYPNKYGTWRAGNSVALPAIVFERILTKIRAELQADNFVENIDLPEGLDTTYEGTLLEYDGDNK